jgi:hypothetical protein
MKKSRTTTRRKSKKDGFSSPRVPWSGKSETYIDEGQQAALQRVDELRMTALLSRNKKDEDAALDAFCEYIQRYNRIDDAVESLPGYAPGVYIIDGRRVLVTGVETAPA